MTSSERRVMYASCSNTPLIRSLHTTASSRDAEEHVFQGRFLDVDAGDPHARLAHLEDEAGDGLLRGVDHHRERLHEPEALDAAPERPLDRAAVAVERERERRGADALGQAERRIVGKDPAAVEADHVVAAPRLLV